MPIHNEIYKDKITAELIRMSCEKVDENDAPDFQHNEGDEFYINSNNQGFIIDGKGNVRIGNYEYKMLEEDAEFQIRFSYSLKENNPNIDYKDLWQELAYMAIFNRCLEPYRDQHLPLPENIEIDGYTIRPQSRDIYRDQYQLSEEKKERFFQDQLDKFLPKPNSLSTQNSTTPLFSSNFESVKPIEFIPDITAEIATMEEQGNFFAPINVPTEFVPAPQKPALPFSPPKPPKPFDFNPDENILEALAEESPAAKRTYTIDPDSIYPAQKITSAPKKLESLDKPFEEPKFKQQNKPFLTQSKVLTDRFSLSNTDAGVSDENITITPEILRFVKSDGNTKSKIYENKGMYQQQYAVKAYYDNGKEISNEFSLRSSNFNHVTFKENNAPGALKIFNDCDLHYTNFRNCVFENVDFSQVQNLYSVKFLNCQFVNCQFPKRNGKDFIFNPENLMDRNMYFPNKKGVIETYNSVPDENLPPLLRTDEDIKDYVEHFAPSATSSYKAGQSHIKRTTTNPNLSPKPVEARKLTTNKEVTNNNTSIDEGPSMIL